MSYSALTQDNLLADDAKADVELLDWLKSKITLTGIEKVLWTAENTAVASDFLVTKGRTKLVAYLEDNRLCLHTVHVPLLMKVKKLQYFLKPNDETTVNMKNIDQMIQFGTMHGGSMESLLNLMNGVYLPTFLLITHGLKVYVRNSLHNCTNSWPHLQKRPTKHTGILYCIFLQKH